MIPYSRGLILDNSSNYGIVKTETVFGFSPTNADIVNSSFNSSDPVEWIITRGNFQRRSIDAFDDTESRALKPEKKTLLPKKLKVQNRTVSKKNRKKSKKTKEVASPKKRKGKGKINKCIFKVLKGGGKRKRKGNNKMSKKYMVPLLLGLLAAKSLLIPVALKALAFISVKGLMMGFFSTIMASFLSLKGMFDHHHHYQNRKDDSKTQVEIIQVPSKSEDHIYYDDVMYSRGDYAPVMDNYVMSKDNYVIPKDNYNKGYDGPYLGGVKKKMTMVND